MHPPTLFTHVSKTCCVLKRRRFGLDIWTGLLRVEVLVSLWVPLVSDPPPRDEILLYKQKRNRGLNLPNFLLYWKFWVINQTLPEQEEELMLNYSESIISVLEQLTNKSLERIISPVTRSASGTARRVTLKLHRNTDISWSFKPAFEVTYFLLLYKK